MRLCPEGWPFVGGSLGATGLLVLLTILFGSVVLGFLSGVALLAALFCAYFFRSPARQIIQGDQYVLCPADGLVVDVVEGMDASSSEPVWIVRIFLSVFDPHLQRAPVRGTVRAVTYKEGKFLDARDPQAAFQNEQNRIEFVAANPALKSPVVVTQVAGLIARRIICDVKAGQVASAGDRIGIIRFGSQVDIVIPKSASMKLKPGQRVTAGDTILAEVSA